MPGLVNLHSHPHTEPAAKGVREDHGVPEMYDTGLYERSCAFTLDEAGRRAAMEMAYAELLLSGVTTVVDLSGPVEGWIDRAGRSGLRVYVGPFFADAYWKLEGRHALGFDWDEARGRRDFEESIRLMDLAEQHPCGRLRGIVYPGQIETCTEGTLRDAAAHAREAGRPLTTHLSQSKLEFLEIVRRHGKTPLAYAADVGFLGPDTILGHVIFIDEHPDVRWRTTGDLDRLADSGTTVAHCPSPFARYGHAMAHFGRYRARGVNLGMGTDVAPHNLVEEMRLAIILARVMAGNLRAADTRELFRAATIGGAAALGRDDPRPARAGGEGGSGAPRPRPPRHAPGAGPAPHVRVRGGRPGGTGRLRGRGAGGRGRPAPAPRPGRGRRSNWRNRRPACWPKRRAATSSGEARRRSRPTRFRSDGPSRPVSPGGRPERSRGAAGASGIIRILLRDPSGARAPMRNEITPRPGRAEDDPPARLRLHSRDGCRNPRGR